MMEEKEWQNKVKKVAREIAADFPDVEREDLEQDLTLFVLENEFSGEERWLYKVLVTHAKHKAWEYRKQHLQLTAQYSYRPSDVRKLLDSFFEYRSWPEATTPDDAMSLKGNDGIEMCSDVSWAFDKLPLKYQRAIFARYALGYSPTHGSKEEKALYRAVVRLTEVLNYYSREHTGVGSRRVISNRHAQFIFHDEYSGNDDSPGHYDRY